MMPLLLVVLSQAECPSQTSCNRPPIARSGLASWASYQTEASSLDYVDDSDGDGVANHLDNCPFASNRDQLDSDGDQVGNVCDGCASTPNPGQLDQDGDGLGDACDADRDGDGAQNLLDTCPAIPNPALGGTQSNLDGDALGDACDPDVDGDGFADDVDQCPRISTPSNVPQPGNAGCFRDTDGDSFHDDVDTCISVPNTLQRDTDGDGLGDACDLDVDADGLNDKLADLTPTARDNCPLTANRSQVDDDFDGLGDACDPKFCLVIDPSAPADCLDPQAPFKVFAGGTMSLTTNDRLRLPIFANRNGQAMKARWTVTQRPAGSTAAILHPDVKVSAPRRFSYVYPFNDVSTFGPDVAGRYQLRLVAELVFVDEAYPDDRTSVSTLTLDVR